MISLVKFLLRFSPRIVFTAILGGIISGMSSAALIGVINSAINSGKDEKLTVLLAFVGLASLMLVSGVVSKISLILLAQSAAFELRMSLSRQIIEAPLRFLESYGSPRILASLIDDVQILAGTLLGIPALCINFATVVICLIYIGWLSPWVLGSVFLFTIIGVLSYYTLLNLAWTYLSKAREIQNKLFADFRALTMGTKELKLHDERKTAFLSEELRQNAKTFRSFSTKGSQIYAGADSWGQFLFIILIGLILFILPVLTEVNSTALTGYILALLYIMAPLEVLVNFFPNISRAQVSLGQIESLGLTLNEEQVEAATDPNEQNAPFENLRLENVFYNYKEEKDEAGFRVGPINLTINAGETIFLVGGNGSGKTTLMKLVTGLYLPSEGEATINGISISEENLKWYRSHFSAVFSDFYLFERLLGLDDPLIDKAATAYLEKLQLSEKVTVENGRLSTLDLSQGQRKRLALLTSFLENRDFYIFDEWAADQDPYFKEIFYKELLPQLKAAGKTLLVITHDDRYYSLADRVIKLDYGNVSELEPTDFPPVEGKKSIKVLAAEIKAENLNLPALIRTVQTNETVVTKEKSYKDLVGGNVFHRLFSNELDAPPETLDGKKVWLQRAAAATIIVLSFLSLSVLRTPTAVAESAPDTDFSAARAFTHVRSIAQKPHPVGSAENEEVRRYIIETISRMGLQAEVLTASTVENLRNELKGGTTKNIIVRLPGTEGAKKIALSCHFDSTPYSFGASDDGSAVAALLETIRAIKAGVPHKNDLIFIFTDGEEETMLGARAMRDSSDFLKQIDLVFNFDARGTAGPSIMFETSAGNGWLIKNLADSMSGVVATSVSSDVYGYMPNLTDFTIFRENQLNGLNFAFIDGSKNYHSMLDNAENFNLNSLQHHGNHALSLAKHFGNADIETVKTNDSVYFNLPGDVLVNYSVRWILPQLVIGLGALLFAVWLGFKKHLLTRKGLILGTASGFVSIVVSIALSQITVYAARFLHMIFGGNAAEVEYGSQNIIIGVALLGFGANLLFFGWLWKKTSKLNLFVGNSIFWWLLLLLSSFLFPGSSYLFFWVLLGGLLFTLTIMLRRDREAGNSLNFALTLLPAIPVLLLFVPLCYLLAIALGINSIVAVMVFVSLAIIGLLPQFYLIAYSNRLALSGIIFGAALIFLILGVIPKENTKEYPSRQNLFYALNADTKQAIWANTDSEVNVWTKQFLSDKPETGQILDYFPSNYSQFQFNQADVSAQLAPEIEIVGEALENGKRNLRLRLFSRRQASTIYLFAPVENQITSVRVKDASLELANNPAQKDWKVRKLLTYQGIPPEGLEINIETAPGAPVQLIFLDQTFGLPLIEGKTTDPLPENMIFSDLIYNNSTLVSKSFKF